MTDLHDKARACFDSPRANDAEPTAIIAALLAENERLTHALAAQVAATNGASAYAVEQTHRAEAAEARLRQLASAEPVRCPLCQYQNGHRIGCDNNPVDIALRLIPRPSMESNNG